MMLSPIQKEIVETSGNLIVRASAGTGKTHTMVSKIKHDIEENHTHKVVAAITFTIKAAAEIKDRLNIDVSEHFIGTNNSFAIEEIIKPFMKDVYTSDDKNAEIYAKNIIGLLAKSHLKMRDIATVVNCKNCLKV